MKVYFIGILGTGLKPLAELTRDAGLEVAGSDRGERVGEYGVEEADWVVYSSAVPENDLELTAARAAGKRCSKRDELINWVLANKRLKLLAVAGSHGKTTTTSMLVWACREAGLPVSYLVGSSLPWAEGRAGHYEPESQFLVYEADEYDRNFLHFRPYVAGITAVSYDHPDVYPTETDYLAAFNEFRSQSEIVLERLGIDPRLTLPGDLRREDASLALAMLKQAWPEVEEEKLIEALNRFPGAGRRFEEVADGVYSDYAHHPDEVAATIKMALEMAKMTGKTGVVVVYEPHQNARQIEVANGYKEAFIGVRKLYWLPTYLTREPEGQVVLQPTDFIKLLDGVEAEPAEADEELAGKLQQWQAENYLVLLMTAGPADSWFRTIFS
jgi:UDP-N-acetylmuramate--alanine ligase